jgi:molecular chaperone GrpE
MEDPTQEVLPGTPAGGEPSSENGATDLEALAADRDRLAAEREDLWDRLVRKQAEFENFRKRTAREKEEVLQFAAMETIRGLLPVLDDFERGLQAPGGDEEYRKGMELIYRRLYDLLLQMGMTPIEALGKKFDPHLHQAVDRLQTTVVEDQTIVEEYQRGYEFRGRLLRPAMVKVAVQD